MVLLKEFFKLVDFEKNQQTTIKSCQNTWQRVNCSTVNHRKSSKGYLLTMTTAADDNFCTFFLILGKKQGLIFHLNRLLPNVSHKISNLICYF